MLGINGVVTFKKSQLADVLKSIPLTRIVLGNLKWEKNYNMNLGLDLAFIDRIFVTLEYYNRDTKDLLYNRPISAILLQGCINGIYAFFCFCLFFRRSFLCH